MIAAKAVTNFKGKGPPVGSRTRISNMEMIGKKCIVRTYSAGVFFGELAELDGKIGVVKNARRIWYWAGAASLSQLALDGTSDPKNCKFPEAVDSVYLSEIIEVIPATEKATTSIEGVPIWRQ